MTMTGATTLLLLLLLLVTATTTVEAANQPPPRPHFSQPQRPQQHGKHGKHALGQLGQGQGQGRRISDSDVETLVRDLIRIPLSRKHLSERDAVNLLRTNLLRLKHFNAIDDSSAVRNRQALGPLTDENGNDYADSANDDISARPKSDLIDGGHLQNLHDNSYNARVTLGNGQTFVADLDTGSSDTWFRGPHCRSTDDSCDGTRVNVNSLTPLGINFTTRYGMGHVRGQVYVTDVSIGDAKARNLLIGVSTSASRAEDTDGIVGLGFPSISQIDIRAQDTAHDDGETNFMNALGLRGYRDVFGFFLSRHGESEDGEVVFGGYDRDRVNGPVTWFPLVGDRYWEFDISRFTYSVIGADNSEKAAPKPLGGGALKTAIADTGTTLVVLDDATAQSINALIGATRHDGGIDLQRFYSIDCDRATDPTAPTVRIHVNDRRASVIELAPDAYVLRMAGGSCLSGFGGGATDGRAIFGDVLLREYYSIYDRYKRRVGLARAVHGIRQSESATEDSSVSSGFVRQRVASDEDIQRERQRWGLHD